MKDRLAENQSGLSYTEEETSHPLSAARIWSRLIYENHPEITSVMFGYYQLGLNYREEVRLLPIDKLKSSGYLADGSYPPSTLVPFTNYNKLHCAIGSMVDTQTPSNNLEVNRSVNKEIPGLSNPKSFVQLDLSCPVDNHNLLTVCGHLNSQPYDWYLLSSGKSYHTVIDTLLDLHQLPSFWADIIMEFSVDNLPDKFRKQSYQVASSLTTNGLSPFALKSITLPLFNSFLEDISNTKGGLDKFGHLSYIDWGYLYFSLVNLIKYQQRRSLGVGFLRISGKKDIPPPVLVASRVKEKVCFENIDDSYFSRQLSFFKTSKPF